MNTMDELFSAVEAEGIAAHRAITPEQHAAEAKRIAAKRDYETLHTPTQVDADEDEEEDEDD
jgi:hypothetical protein